MAKINFGFSGMQDVLKQFREMEKDIDKATENALLESKNHVKENLLKAIKKHHQSGNTEESVDLEQKVFNDGNVAYVNVGFDIDKEIQASGFPLSIFLMYGTKLYGKPHVSPDRQLYNSIYGSSTKKEIQKIQEAEFFKILNS